MQRLHEHLVMHAVFTIHGEESIMNRYFLQFSPLVALLTKGSTRPSGDDFRHGSSEAVPAPAYSSTRRPQSHERSVARMASRPGSWQRHVESQHQSSVLGRWRRAVARWLAILRAPQE